MAPLEWWIATLADDAPTTTRAARALGATARRRGLARRDLFYGFVFHRDKRGGWQQFEPVTVSRIMWAAVAGWSEAPATGASRKERRASRWGSL